MWGDGGWGGALKDAVGNMGGLDTRDQATSFGGSSSRKDSDRDRSGDDNAKTKPAAPATAPTYSGPSFEEILAQYDAMFGKARSAGTNYYNARGINAASGGEFWNPLDSRFEQSLQSFYGAPTKDNYQEYSPILTDQNYLTEAERLAANALDSENTAARQLLSRRAESAFEPYDPYKAIPDTMDDPILSSILGEQRRQAENYLQRALQRGQLRDQGYQQGISTLDQQASAGMSKLQDLGQGVLDRGRGTLGNIKTDAITGAGAFSIGDPFSVDDYVGRAASSLNDFSGNLENDIRAAIGGSSFFDPTTAVSIGGSAQGVQNAGTENSALIAAIRDQKRKSTQDRGLGNQGVF